MDEAILEQLVADVANLKAQMEQVFTTAPVEQARLQAEQAAQSQRAQALQELNNERQFISQLQMEGYTKAEAIAYYDRMKNGERPWLDV